MNNYTSIEQSKNLLKFGLKLDTADMCYVVGSPILRSPVAYGEIPVDELYRRHVVPCWSFCCMIELMPSVIDDKTFKLSIVKDNVVPGYYFRYHNHKENKDKVVIYNKNPVDAAYEMIVWLLENGYIK